MNSVNHAISYFYLCRNSSHVLMLRLNSAIAAQMLVSQSRKLLHIKQLRIQNDRFSPCIFIRFSIINSKYWVFIFSIYPKSFHKQMKNLDLLYKCYRSHKIKLKFFQNMFSKTMVMSDTIDFIMAISCSEKIHVSTKRRLADTYTSF